MKKLAMLVTSLLLMTGMAMYGQMGQMGQMHNNTSGRQQGMRHNSYYMGHNHMNSGYGNSMMGTMNGNMMYGFMPMAKYAFIVNGLPNMREKLALTQDQTEQLIDLRISYKKQLLDQQAKLSKSELKLENLLEDDSPAETVENQLQVCSGIQNEMRIATYKTAGQMLSLLSPDQKEELDENWSQNSNYGYMMGGNTLHNHMMNGGMMQSMYGY